VNRREAVKMLVKTLEAGPNQKKWMKALDRVLDRYWPGILKMRTREQYVAIKKLSAIVEEARARVRQARLDHEEQLLLTALSLHDGSDPRPDLTPEEQEFYSNLQFGWDEGKGKFYVLDESGTIVH
jgi:hypothetical protein